MTAYAYSTTELEDIEDAFNLQDWPTAYMLAATYAEASNQVDASVISWLKGAAGINGNTSAGADFVRSYSEAQHMIRFGTALLNFQSESDDLAYSVIDAILTTGSPPTLSQIASKDGTDAAASLFQGDLGAWAGNPLFLGLGDDGPLQTNILHDNGDTYDALVMMKLVTADLATMFSASLDDLGNIGYNTGTILSGITDTSSYLIDAYGIIGGLSIPARNIEVGRTTQGDLLSTTSASDIVHGSGGNDTILAHVDDDIIDGGFGEDTVDYSFNSDLTVTIDAEYGDADRVGRVVGSSGTDKLYGVEKIIGSISDDTFNIINLVNLPLELQASSGHDTLDLSDYESDSVVDLITGTVSIDFYGVQVSQFESYVGNSRDNEFILDNRTLSVDAGDGYDRVVLSADPAAAAAALDGGDGRDEVSFEALTAGLVGTFQAGPITFRSYSIDNFEGIVGTNYADNFTNLDNFYYLDGGGGDDTLVGSDDGDFLIGGDGQDTITGGAEGDDLFGGNGDDIIVGGGAANGTDYIYGDDGNDTLYITLNSEVSDGLGSDIIHLPGASGYTSNLTTIVIDGMYLNALELSESIGKASLDWDAAGTDTLMFNNAALTSLTIKKGIVFQQDGLPFERAFFMGESNLGHFFIESFYSLWWTETSEEPLQKAELILNITGDISDTWEEELFPQDLLDVMQGSIQSSVQIENWWDEAGISVTADSSVWGGEHLANVLDGTLTYNWSNFYPIYWS